MEIRLKEKRKKLENCGNYKETKFQISYLRYNKTNLLNQAILEFVEKKYI